MGKRLIDGLWLLGFAVAGCAGTLNAQETGDSTHYMTNSFEPFTGRVMGNKVRIRLEPSIDSPILDELRPDDMVIVLNEKDGFYGIRPPANIKAYVYRTYVIDDVIEGNRVNVRSEPHLDAPVLVQMNKGERVEGHVSPLNNKWLQVKLPEHVRFYVATDFIENVGDVDMVARLETRRQEASEKVDRAFSLCQDELAKNFIDIDLGKACFPLECIIVDYADVPEQGARARQLLADNQEAYNRKKIDYLQSQAAHASDNWNTHCKDLAEQMAAQQAHLDLMELCLQNRDTEHLSPVPSRVASLESEVSEKKTEVAAASKESLPECMTCWVATEAAAYSAWVQSNPEGTIDQFYQQQAEVAMQLHGIVQPYKRLIKTKPGNFILMGQGDNMPIAFLYSTKVNLESLLSKAVTLQVAPRANNNYAFPAYFVLDASIN